MNIEKTIKDCEIYLKQIKQYDPDPYYVNYFFNEYINSVNDIFNGIFEEGNRNFGLFISEKISQKKFDRKAKIKNDQNAMKFSEWYLIRYNQEHENSYPNFIKKICQFKNKFDKLPKIKIMIRASDRYEDDINQQIKVNLSNEKLCSKEELEIEVKRQLPIFLETINRKRSENNEPKVRENQVIASAFLEIEEYKDIEIVYAAEIYIPVIKRLVEESKKKIKELT
ncbi:hypothetical protein HX860_03115 [Marine Group I thaumarchaeote]|jgi:hypothetical protein|uniref:Uncharacterized protein n=1 Tax=Marine Group I thaumarchaeote TaxID=2511932 RepID=A0A7K4MJM6_9ARCH|nr:hypothetical protein JI55_00130 [Nitrosopumilus sp. PRT-SC01]MCH2405392.1 hypothetical protein [Nitrosopumilus sp.]NWJ20047.1 hypothetical protein [Marine Group I thaumarchaeote]NWJ29411.1 hypothetical protein [Marine Group I thaumarchaeote]NWJ84583.1 hypothetical protein [Marine Group I thaumarchaeote]